MIWISATRFIPATAVNGDVDSDRVILSRCLDTMKTSLQQLLTGLGCCWALAHLPGCMPMAGPGSVPNWSPRQPIGIYNPQPFPGASPWYPVGYPPFPGGPGTPIVMLPAPIPGGPGIPIVMNPTPVPGPTPGLPNPDSPPTIPVGVPIPAPTEPQEDSNDFWSPWPLPPRGNQLAVREVGLQRDRIADSRKFRSSGQYGVSRPQLGQFVSATANEDLKYRGGRIIRDLSYVNLYISGDTEWSTSDIEQIDRSLSAAMRDEHLNNVLLQYYNNQPIRSSALPSHPLIGHTPKTVSRGDIQSYVSYLHRQGFLRSFDLSNTVINLMLPPGTVLTSDDAAANSQSTQSGGQASRSREFIAERENVDSRDGLGGYHGSVVSTNGEKVYFAVGVYAERFANGATNGIPVFSEPWKNVVATLYHQLIEARTDPDVEDAIRDPSELNSDRTLGWVSDSGFEIGDLPIGANVPIRNVVREVPLADGSGTVPVQLPYSNFIRGPEGPITQPHPLPSR